MGLASSGLSHGCIRDFDLLLRENNAVVKVHRMAEDVASMVSSLMTSMGYRPNELEKLDSTFNNSQNQIC